ncbi:50S ribosomal protein L3 [Candidatus Woesearchaeota archaeon]|nr:50S ribosomal protein L3 [Candidatus Woesearchaeota archaeon]
MGNVRHPRRGSLQFWPRKRSRHSVARIRSWTAHGKSKPLGFIAYKAGMTHLMIIDNRPKSLTKGEKIMIPATILECPPLTVIGIAFYRRAGYGIQKFASITAPKLEAHLAQKFPLPKKAGKTFESIQGYDDLRFIVQTHPSLIASGSKRPQVQEIAIGGTVEEKARYAQEMLGKEITINDVVSAGNLIDVHGITIGKGFQGTVKRYGVPIRQHKAEKTKRGIATLGSWTPKRVEFTVAQAGKMGFHSRTEYNKHVLKVGAQGNEVNPMGGFIRYGLVKNPYLLVKGSVMGPKKRAVFLTHALRPDTNIPTEAPEITYLSRRH